MYRQCSTEKTAMQQKAFQDALFTALLDHSYTEITIIDLCNQTGLTRNIFYRLFDCKDDVLNLLIDYHFYECSQHISTQDTKQSLFHFFTYWKEHKPLLDILEKNQLNHLLATRGSICCSQKDFGMQKYIHLDWNHFEKEIYSFYIGGFIGLLFYWYHQDFLKTEEEMVDITFQLFHHPPIKIT